ncbi:MAG: YdcF family protein [Candidatus Magasanikbacteria bacterium]|nr:YdcF family protein [Candidatus Magasanikbacteria bacterium]
MRNYFKLVCITGLLVGFLGLVILVSTNIFILKNAAQIYSVNTVPTSSLAIIFGGGMKNNGTEMSDMQWDRVSVGAELFKTGKVERLMITGDDGWFKANEITAMKNRLLELGVPEEKISADPHGYRTYESCIREAQLFSINSAIVISQSFHLPRIQYLCEHFGIETTLVQADVRVYESWWVPNAREWLARVKAVWQVEVTKPQPMILN